MRIHLGANLIPSFFALYHSLWSFNGQQKDIPLVYSQTLKCFTEPTEFCINDAEYTSRKLRNDETHKMMKLKMIKPTIDFPTNWTYENTGGNLQLLHGSLIAFVFQGSIAKLTL